MLGERHGSIGDVLIDSSLLTVPRMRSAYPAFRQGLGREFLGRGAYPCDWPVRTPIGIVRPRLHDHRELRAVTDAFCRRHHPARRDLATVVDVGARSGIDALYFLTRNRAARAWLYETDPESAGRLRHNLRGHERRWTLREAAVGPEPGAGRPGINDVLEEALVYAPVVDVLRVRAGGAELELVRAIRPELLGLIRTVYADLAADGPLAPDGFTASVRGSTLALRNPSL